MAYNGNFELALASVKAQKVKKYKATALQYGVERIRPRLYAQGKRTSRAEAASIHTKLLSTAQEEVLLGHLDALTLKGMPPTKEMLENLVTEVVGHPVGHCWVDRFIERYKHRITSPYIRVIDNSRKVADNSANYKYYFTRESIFPCLVSQNFANY